MTAYFGYADKTGAYILSDAAANANGKLHSLTSKVLINKNRNFAVVGAGNQFFIQSIAEILCKMADEAGDIRLALRNLPAAVKELRKYVESWQVQHGLTDNETADILIAAYHSSVGGQIRLFRTREGNKNRQVVPPFQVIEDSQGSSHSINLEEAGIPLVDRNFPLDLYLRHNGGKMMDLARLQTWKKTGVADVGGRVDFTTLTANGARTSVLKTWPEDKIGEPIVPIGT